MKHNALEEHNENEIKAVLDQDSLENEVSSKFWTVRLKSTVFMGRVFWKARMSIFCVMNSLRFKGLKTERQKILPNNMKPF
jgi:hypothetical protein